MGCLHHMREMLHHASLLLLACALSSCWNISRCEAGLPRPAALQPRSLKDCINAFSLQETTTSQQAAPGTVPARCVKAMPPSQAALHTCRCMPLVSLHL